MTEIDIQIWVGVSHGIFDDRKVSVDLSVADRRVEDMEDVDAVLNPLVSQVRQQLRAILDAERKGVTNE